MHGAVALVQEMTMYFISGKTTAKFAILATG